MTRIPVGFRCSTDRYKAYLKAERELKAIDRKIKKHMGKLHAVKDDSPEQKNIKNTVSQLEASYKIKKRELDRLTKNKPQFVNVEVEVKKAKKKKQKSIQQIFRENEQHKKLKTWNSIQKKARLEREIAKTNNKKAQVTKQKAITDRIAAQEVRKVDDSLKLLSNITLSDMKMNKEKVDVFISHASEDKDSIVRELADSLIAAGVNVWYDEYSLSIGDSLSSSINKGLSECTFGIVILSPNFIKKRWPEVELQSLYAREVHKGKTILPIWHRITFDEVISFNLHLADKFAYNSSIHSIEKITTAITKELDKKLTEMAVN